ncbi:MAG: outer membrane protein assembly factor BamA [Deltaproteobacteria bacterium]|nr:outer membrane protein assembly factor BamA [Deltaproteobacteria bacterium]MCB9785974.1 outer membrane protein assembly factor BamA [Deltaproteobacteria bacterium]
MTCVRRSLSVLCLVAGLGCLGPALPSAHGQQLRFPSLDTPKDTTVRGIEILGLQRIDRAGVRAKIYTQVGRPLDAARLSEDLKRIYRTGFFEDVQVAEREHPDGGVVLLIHVVERPTIVELDYDVKGKAVDLDEIKKVVDLKLFSTLDEAAIQQNLAKIRELYSEEGHFLVSTHYTVAPRPQNGVKVTLHVDEGEKVEVRHVHIVGNDAVTDTEIKSVLATREGGWFSFLTKSGQFKRELFEQDMQRIQLLYLSKGYIEATVETPIVTLSPDKRSMSISIRVSEGPQYSVASTRVEMEDDQWLVDKDELEAKIELKPGDIFDWTRMQSDAQRIGDVFRDLGYANATVTNGHKLHEEDRTLELVFTVQRGDPVYFRRIEIRGNKTTRDKVIRRELKVSEGELYSASRLRASQSRILSTGFFEPESVQVTPQPTDRPDQMDVVVDLKEKSTGTFQVGAGFSSLESFVLTAQISKENFLGRGQSLSAQALFSGIRQQFSLSFFEPYFFDTRLTFAFDIFNFRDDYADFTNNRTGGSLSWGYRLTDELSLSLTYTLQSTNTDIRGTRIPLNLARQSGLNSSLRGTVTWDSRDNRLFPTRGNFTTLSAETASRYFGSENEFTRLIGRTRFYFPLPLGLIFKTNATLGYVTSPEAEPIPLNERFFVGGIFTVRGFERNSIGQKLYIADNPDEGLRPFSFGGTKELILNAELEIPIFLELGIRGVLFFDAGNAWGDNEVFKPYQLRTSAGFGFRWQSPVGPLRFEWGFPLKPKKGEDPMVFEFTIGNSF